ncbi:hypothetical protein BKA63DRAFT_504206 [Paraphoma chrysanthemicola]|nr:hypothetical protein BKA63DRAFT_504206 [Paraphoma chrysanthemicola]
MKFAAATTALFATLALASPAPAAQPDAAVAVAEPLLVERAPHPVLEARKKSKPKGGSGNDTSAAVALSPSLALQLGAVGLGVMEVVRLWA